jgi:hypothetical protein
MTADVSDFLNRLPADAWQLVSVLRKLIRRLVPNAQESVVWGSLSFHRPEIGGRVKGAVCMIVVRDHAVRLDFIHGIRLSDPAGLLQGSLVSKRFVPIESVEDARRPEVAALIRAAAAVDPTQWTERE